MTGAVNFPLESKPSVKSYRQETQHKHPTRRGRITTETGTCVEVENFTGDHHGKELFSRSWKSVADGLTNVHGDLGDSSKPFRALLLDLVRTRDRHDIDEREAEVCGEVFVWGCRTHPPETGQLLSHFG